MSWLERVREAAYTSPDGTRIPFFYENVSRDTPLRNKAFEFPGVNDAYIQPNGFGPRQYPLRVYFWGDDHDLQATQFEQALLEPGVGRLEHPFYGALSVVPMGSITRRDDLKDGSNQTIFEVTWFTTTGLVYPAPQSDPRSELAQALADYEVAAASQFDADIQVQTEIARQNLSTTVQGFLQTADAALGTVAAFDTAVINEFRDAQDAINFSLDVLVGEPLVLAQQITNMITIPGRALTGIVDRVLAYGTFAQDIFASVKGQPGTVLGFDLPRTKTKIQNDWVTSDLNASTGLAGTMTSVLNNTFETKPDALNAANSILEQADALIPWREQGYTDTELIDVGTSYQALTSAAALAAGFLVEISFTLIPEKRIVLDRARTILDVAAEVYGSVDDRLDFLIQSNSLTGSEILELPRGRTIVYYP